MQLVRRVALAALPLRQPLLQIGALHQERTFALLKQILLDQPVNVGIGQAIEPVVDLRQLQRQGGNHLLLFLGVAEFHLDEFWPKPGMFVLRELEPGEPIQHGPLDSLLADTGRGAVRNLAPVVNVAFLSLAHKGIAAALASQTAAIQEVMLEASSIGLAVQDLLDLLKKLPPDQRVVHALEGLVRCADMDQPHVERVVEQLGDSVWMKLVATAPPEPQPVEFRTEGSEVVAAGAVQLESLTHHWCSFGIECLGLAGAVVHVAEWRRHGEQPLLEPAPKALLGFLPEVADVIGGDHGLNVIERAEAVVEAAEDEPEEYGYLVEQMDRSVTFDFMGRQIYNPKMAWKMALLVAGVRHMRFHDLRHTFNTRLMEAGVIQEIRMALMGHSPGSNVHARYTHIDLLVKREAIRKLEEWRIRQTQSMEGRENSRSDDQIGAGP